MYSGVDVSVSVLTSLLFTVVLLEVVNVSIVWLIDCCFDDVDNPISDVSVEKETTTGVAGTDTVLYIEDLIELAGEGVVFANASDEEE